MVGRPGMRILSVAWKIFFALALAGVAGPHHAQAKNSSAAIARADSLTERVEVLSRLGRPAAPELLAAAREAFVLRERELGHDDPRTLASLEQLATIHLGRVEIRAADSLMERVVAARIGARKPDPHATIVSLQGLAETHRNVKKLAQSVSIADSALMLLRQLATPDTTLEVRLHTILGNVFSEQGTLARSRAELERAVSLAESRAHPDSASLASALFGLGRTLDLAGDLPGALAALERAAAIEERIFGPDSPEFATTLFMTTYALAEKGDYVTQRRYAERAMTIREHVFGSDHPNLAPILWVLGNAEANLGDPQAAQRHYERAEKILREAPAASPANLATALNNIGSNSLRLGDGPRALAAFREAKAMREKLFGPGRGRSFWSETRLAHAMLMSGDAASAILALDSLLAGPTAPQREDVSDALTVRGSALRALGRLAAAHDDFDRVYVVDDSLFGAASPVTLGALALRAAVRYQLGRRAGAFDDAMLTEAASRSAIREIARGLSESEALGFERVRGSGLDVLVELAADSVGLGPEQRAAALDAVVQSRLVVLDELADERRALPRGNTELDVLHQRLDLARDEYAAAMVGALRAGRAPDSLADAARERRQRAERELAERSGPFRDALHRSAADLAAVAAALPPGSALVSYVRHTAPADMGDYASSDFAPRPRRAQYSAFVLSAGSRTPAIVNLGPVADIERRVERWITACATPPPPEHATALAAVRRCDRLGGSVRAAVWAPLEHALAGASRVFVVPDGALHAINFLALPDVHGRYLAESGPLVHRLTAERDLVAWDAAAVPPRGLLAFGGVDFEHASDGTPGLLAAASAAEDRRSPRADSLRVHFAPLPATADEIAEVARTWRASADPGERDYVTQRTGAAATEEAFKRLAPGNRVLHLATHGFALGAGDARVVPDGTRAVGAVLGDSGRPARHRAAALLPGLALAGANHDPDPTGEDGFLTAEEITSLDLTGVEWAVLSACESGLSDPEAVEAVQGLHRAFRRAGARTVIMSLWLVDDASTRSWMDKLYAARLARGLSTAAAVQDACRGLLHERRARGLDTHPFYWAAFVAAGDWR